MMVRCVYKDPPFSLSNPYEDAKLIGKNAASRYKPGTRVEQILDPAARAELVDQAKK